MYSLQDLQSRVLRTPPEIDEGHAWTLDTVRSALGLPIPHILKIKDVNIIEVLLGATETLSGVNFLLVSLNYRRRDYYYMSAEIAIPTIIEILQQEFLLIAYFDDDGSSRDYLFERKE